MLLGQSYLTVAVTFERYIEVSMSQKGRASAVDTTTRLRIICAVLAFSLFMCVPMALTIKIDENDKCWTGLLIAVDQSSVFASEDFVHFTKKIIDPIVKTMFPFVSLLSLNFLIVYRNKQALKRPNLVRTFVTATHCSSRRRRHLTSRQVSCQSRPACPRLLRLIPTAAPLNTCRRTNCVNSARPCASPR